MQHEEAKPVGAGETFHVPLSSDEFETLGQITAQFGQIERVIDALIMLASGVTNFHIYSVLCGSAPFGAKLKILEDLVDIQRGAFRAGERVKEATKALKKVATLRNHAVHGAWGLLHEAILEGPNNEAVFVGQGHVAAPGGSKAGKPMMASDLANLLQSAEGAARLTMEAYVAVTGMEAPTYPMKTAFVDPRTRSV